MGFKITSSHTFFEFLETSIINIVKKDYFYIKKVF